MGEIFTVETRGIGKPDYSREISLGKVRPGLTLKFNQGLRIFGRVFSAVNTGTHTAAPHATIMTDAAAHFTANALVLLTIINVTDGSSGTIIANSETTVTVVLTGGVNNQWNTGDAYTIPSPFANVTLPLAPGETVHFIDSETGSELPFIVPAGYTLTSISAGSSFNQDAMMWGYFGGYLRTSVGVPAGGSIAYEAEVVAFGTSLLDPTAESAHPIDVQITNRGGGNLEGGIAIYGILEAVGTKPLPAIKTVKCKHCQHQWDVPVETTQLICPKCSKLTIVYDLSKFRGTP